MSESVKDQLLAPNYQMGIVLRKVYDKTADRWQIQFGVRNSEHEIILGFTYQEMEQVQRALYSVMDSFTEAEKRRGFIK